MKITIITINYNNAQGLKKTMESVLSQTSHNFEYIVVDGTPQPPKGGIGEDIEVLQSFINEKSETEGGFTGCTWKLENNTITGGFYSESDSGIYNAMNKGIRMAKGEYVQFLNSGDWLVDEKVVEDMLSQLPDCDLFIGRKISVRSDGKRQIEKQSREISMFTFYRSTLQHTSAYIRKSLFDVYGLYDESLKIVADWKWYLLVAGLHKTNVQFTERCVSYFDVTGISSTNLVLDKTERRKVLEELIPAPILADYDRYCFDIVQMERLKRYPLLYKLVWLVERGLFKLEKWKNKYCGWR